MRGQECAHGSYTYAHTFIHAAAARALCLLGVFVAAIFAGVEVSR